MAEQRLKTYQEIFWNLITSPNGVEKGLKQHSDIRIEDWFMGDEKLPPVRRLNIYANMYFWRIHDAIQEDYPAVFAVIGKENWNNLMTDYLLRYPSDTPFLQYAGKHLPAFLRESHLLARWPYLYDLAVLEWERTMLFEAADSPYIMMQDLQKLPPEDWPTLRLKFVAAFKTVELNWRIDSVWRQVEAKETLVAPSHERCALKIWRKDFVVYHQEMSPEENEAIQMVRYERPFKEICERVGDAKRAAHFLAGWVEQGLIAR